MTRPRPPGSMDADEAGDYYDRAVNIVLRDRKVSTSYIQRRLSVGYNKAASLVERMEKEGVVSAPNHSGNARSWSATASTAAPSRTSARTEPSALGGRSPGLGCRVRDRDSSSDISPTIPRYPGLAGLRELVLACSATSARLAAVWIRARWENASGSCRAAAFPTGSYSS